MSQSRISILIYWKADSTTKGSSFYREGIQIVKYRVIQRGEGCQCRYVGNKGMVNQAVGGNLFSMNISYLYYTRQEPLNSRCSKAQWEPSLLIQADDSISWLMSDAKCWIKGPLFTDHSFSNGSKLQQYWKRRFTASPQSCSPWCSPSNIRMGFRCLEIRVHLTFFFLYDFYHRFSQK